MEFMEATFMDCSHVSVVKLMSSEDGLPREEFQKKKEKQDFVR